jgi:hypothetical protein
MTALSHAPVGGPGLDVAGLVADLTDQGVGPLAARLAAWIRAQGAVKAVARDLGAAPAAVRNWRDGAGCSGATLERLCDHYGEPLVEWLFAPWLDRLETDALASLARAERELAALRAALEMESREDVAAAFSIGARPAPRPAGGMAHPARAGARAAARGLALALMLGAALVAPVLETLADLDPARVVRVDGVPKPRNGQAKGWRGVARTGGREVLA